jgi:hypothetical protein
MGQEAEITEEELESEETTEEETATAEEEVSEDGEKPEENEEFEVIRETATQATKDSDPPWVKARLSKISAKKNEAQKEAANANEALELEKEKNRLLQMALEQKEASKSLALPNPEDFDGGIHDPEYLKKFQDYNAAIIEKTVDARVSAVSQKTTEQADQGSKAKELERKKVKHWNRAHQAGAKNFEATEDKAIEILGPEIVDTIIDRFDDSHVLVHYLGTEKNSSEARNLRALMETDLVLGIAEIGRLRSELKVKSPSKRESTPDPDGEIEGAIPPNSKKRGLKGAKYY